MTKISGHIICTSRVREGVETFGTLSGSLHKIIQLQNKRPIGLFHITPQDLLGVVNVCSTKKPLFCSYLLMLEQ